VRRLDAPGSVSLVLPNMLIYVPCARQPRLSEGVVEVPNEIVAFERSYPVGLATSPFSGLLDLYQLDRLPLTDAKGVPLTDLNWTPRMAVLYDVGERIPGSETATPDKRTE